MFSIATVVLNFELVISSVIQSRRLSRHKFSISSMQGFAAGLMLSISFFDLAHNAINSIGFLKGNIWVRFFDCFLPN